MATIVRTKKAVSASNPALASWINEKASKGDRKSLLAFIVDNHLQGVLDILKFYGYTVNNANEAITVLLDASTTSDPKGVTLLSKVIELPYQKAATNGTGGL